MPDRAVVEDEMCPYCEARQMAGHGFPSPECPTCDKTGYVPVITNGTVRTRDGQQIWPQPRALVALSEDRQWLVVLFPNVHKLRDMWAILRCKWDGDFTCWDTVADTGQDAHAVLARWLEGRNHA